MSTPHRFTAGSCYNNYYMALTHCLTIPTCWQSNLEQDQSIYYKLEQKMPFFSTDMAFGDAKVIQLREVHFPF